MGHPVIVSACRSPIGRFQGGLSSLTATKLGTVVATEAIRRGGIDTSLVEEVVMGCVLQAGLGQNPARQVLLGSGVDNGVAAVTVNKVCGSGLKAVMMAAQAIKAGDLSCALAGGMESMSNVPYYLPDARRGKRLGNAIAVDGLIHDGLWDVYNDFHMGNSGELVAKKYDISRRRQDEYAAESHRRATSAAEKGRFEKELVPVEVLGRKGEVTVVDRDEGPRRDCTVEGLAALKPAFAEDGTVTAGNASTINDGAAATVVMDEDVAVAEGLKPLARILGYSVGGLAPEWVMMAPEVAVGKLCAMLSCQVSDFDLVEINEAFAVQMVALIGTLGLDPEKLNVNGGGVALGHPIGCSGARVLTTLLYALEQRDLSRGIAALCLGGGNAVAMAVERVA